jgi:copper chaperone NosL
VMKREFPALRLPALRLTALRLPTLLLLAVALVTGCAPKPDAVHWGLEECAQCQMVISDERFAAQVVDQRGKTYKFDAIECMAAFVDGGALAAGDIHSLWIADGRDSWVAVEDAAFLYSENTRSPMGGGYTAHADGDAARRLQAEVGGELMTWQQVRDRASSMGRCWEPAGGQLLWHLPGPGHRLPAWRDNRPYRLVEAQTGSRRRG